MTIKMTIEEARLALIALGNWRSDYEGCAVYDDRASAASALTSRLVAFVDHAPGRGGMMPHWEAMYATARAARAAGKNVVMTGEGDYPIIQMAELAEYAGVQFAFSARENVVLVHGNHDGVFSAYIPGVACGVAVKTARRHG